jgi:hypothetical protein
MREAPVGVGRLVQNRGVGRGDERDGPHALPAQVFGIDPAAERDLIRIRRMIQELVLEACRAWIAQTSQYLLAKKLQLMTGVCGNGLRCRADIGRRSRAGACRDHPGTSTEKRNASALMMVTARGTVLNTPSNIKLQPMARRVPGGT